MGASPSSYVATEPATTVQAFFAALEDRAVNQALELTDPRIVWRNTSLPTVKGKLVARLLKGMDRDWMGFRATFHHIAASGDVVLTERTDYLRVGPLEIDFWVCGTFRIGPDGRIVLWHDYFSWTNVAGGVVRGLFRMVSRPRRAPSRR
jgi:limonene-1,2-epoxide hydrolase